LKAEQPSTRTDTAAFYHYLCYASETQPMTPEQAQNEARSGELRPVYLIVGDEPYFERQVLTELKRAALAGAVPGLNDEYLQAGEVTVERVLGAARTLPMMAKRRLVVVRGLERWEPRDGQEEGKEREGKEREPPLDRLLEYAKAPSPSTVLVLVGGGLDKRRRLVTQARSLGFLVSCEPLERAALPGFVQREVQARGARIASDTADLVAELTGPELSQVVDAVDRMSLYVGDQGEITEDVVAECVVRLRPSTVWELVGAVGRRDLGAALRALDQVYDPADRGLRLLGVLAWSTRQLVKFDAAQRAGASPSEAAQRAGAPPFKARELAAQLKGLEPADLERFILRLAELDGDLKGGSKRQPKASLEHTILALVGSGRGRKPSGAAV
jgi:DNA polymerase-3 subunit delta